MYNKTFNHKTYSGICVNRPYGDRDNYSDFIIPPYVY